MVTNLDKTSSLNLACNHDDKYKTHDSARWYDTNVHILHCSLNKMEASGSWGEHRQRGAHRSHRYNEGFDHRLGQRLYIVGHLHRCTGCHDTPHAEGGSLKQCVNEMRIEGIVHSQETN